MTPSPTTSTETASDPRHIVIVGGVAGGMSTAARLRRLDEAARITVIERSGHVSFANCGLPYYVGGVIQQREALLLHIPESLAARFGLEVRVHTEVTAIDRDHRTLTLRRVAPEGTATGAATETGATEELHYDELVLSPGARPRILPIPGIKRALPLRDIEDTDRLAAAVAQARTAVVMGAGFIGVEVAENLAHRGLDVTVVEFAPQVLAPLDAEMAQIVADRMRDHGVALHLGHAVTELTATEAALDDGTRLPADLVVAAVGVQPDTALAREAGLEIGPRGGIVVDDRLRTSDPHIWAVGDAVEKIDALTGEPALVPLANTANRQGRLLADVLTGRERTDRPVLGTSILGVFGLQVAATGWNERRLRAAGRPYRAIHTHPASHAGYHPGAATMALKLLVDPQTDAILGAQGVGEDGVDKRIDVIATAMAGGLTASDLADLELAYAPAFGSAKDPVNMLGYVADNLRTGQERTLQWHELPQALSDGEVLLDVRSAGEHAAWAIPGAVNIPVDELRERLDEVPEGPVVVHCAVGVRGHIAAQVLQAAGREVRNLDGGYRTWSVARELTV
ncbi:FAD-dependent oxidoreductase [Brachybacterium sp. EF45031]|uniref:FAD-dependent oxidoreductase n=1 Tax=Brachybacterium sillae TaxID=2810536 RepID=UPI00217E2FCE|nr:FAD-dependent oxidoreductase [Brachybacterium sillae]MCS6712010.1 FAD-dependent oxidoreductase [Brachybacterium sillae]